MNIRLKRFVPNEEVKPFNCGDDDLNNFLTETNPYIPNAFHHTNELLAVTYLLEDADANQTVAYFSLLNDKIERDLTDGAVWNRLSREIPNIKRRTSHPSVKLGRLAISSVYQKQQWGTKILLLLKRWFTHNNKTGCRFITVDALLSAKGFYEKNGFKILVEPKPDDDTVLMYYDLKKFTMKP